MTHILLSVINQQYHIKRNNNNMTRYYKALASTYLLLITLDYVLIDFLAFKLR